MPIDNLTTEINTGEYLSVLKEYMRGAEGTWYYEGIYYAHTDISRFSGWIDLIERFGTVEDKISLDVGCGSGGMPIAMMKRGARAYGIEIDRGLYEISKVRFKNIPSVEVFLRNGKTFLFENDFFDIITIIHVLEHVDNIEAFLTEIFRVLKKGGRCILECPNRLFPLEPHNKIPFITYLPKGLADIICVDLLSKAPFFKKDLRLRLKNVGSFSHFVSTCKLVNAVNKMDGHILLKNPVERILGEVRIPKSLMNCFQKIPGLMNLFSSWFSRNAMVIFTK